MSFAASGRPEEQHIGLRQFDLVTAPDARRRLLVLNTPVMVVNRDRQNLFCVVLANYILIEKLRNFSWAWKIVEGNLSGFAEFFFDDFVAKVDAFVADVHTWTSDELLHLLLRLATE